MHAFVSKKSILESFLMDSKGVREMCAMVDMEFQQKFPVSQKFHEVKSNQKYIKQSSQGKGVGV